MAQDESQHCPKCSSVMEVKGTVTSGEKTEELLVCVDCGHVEWQKVSDQRQPNDRSPGSPDSIPGDIF